jgi:hypothetical protein
MQNDTTNPIRVRIKDRNLVEEIQNTVPQQIKQPSPEIFTLEKKPRKPRKKRTTNFNNQAKIQETQHVEKNGIKETRRVSKPPIWPKIKTKIQDMVQRFLHFAISPHPIKNWIIVIVIVMAIVVPMILLISNSTQHAQLTQQYGMFAKLRELKQTHDYYSSMATKDELLISWVKMFSNWRYKQGGDPRYNTGDCVGAVHQFLQKWESVVAFEDVNGIIQRCKNLEERGEILKRTNPLAIKHGDLIIFNFGVDIPKHVGIVYDYTNGWVRYMDVNAVTGTWGFEKVKWGTPSIHAVYNVSFALWIGDTVRNLSSSK